MGLVVLFAPVAAAAPVPTHLMPQPEVQLRYTPGKPLADSFTITLRNAGPADLQIWSDRLGGLATFLDAEILNEKNERVSRHSAWDFVAQTRTNPELVQTIPPRQSVSLKLDVFQSLLTTLEPGKYRVRIRFRYHGFNAASDWVTVHVSRLDSIIPR
jgi:hypothetical protein